MTSPAFIRPSQLRQRGMLGMTRRNIDYIGRYNQRRLYPLVDDKLKTKLLAQEYGVPTPQLRFVVREQHEIHEYRARIQEMEQFVLKPAKGSGGKGILVVNGRDGENFVKSSGAVLTMADLERHMSNTLAGLYSLSGVPDVVIAEDLIAFDDGFAGYSYEGVPDIRIIGFRGYPVMAMLRLATHASDGKANLHQGAVGVGLGMDTGRCLYAVQDGQRCDSHPDTGKPLNTLQIDNWQELLVLASRCYEMTGLGYMGTDLVLDARQGPQLLELNARPGLAIQVANDRGLLPRLRKIEAMRERRQVSAQDRVAFAMEAFA